MGGTQKSHRKLSVSDHSNKLRQAPSASGSLGSTTASSSLGSASKSHPSSSSDLSTNKRSQSRREQAGKPRPLVQQRHGRIYLDAPGVAYPLPIDLPELHRQSLRTMLLIEVYGGPLRSPVTNAPKRVLEIGCGPGIWSLLCHRYLKKLGYTGVSFTGIDITPPECGIMMPDADMDWTFVQHDMVNNSPWPFPDNHFDIIFHKEMTLAVPIPQHGPFTEQWFRVLKPGGTLEIWEVDHIIRLLRPHSPQSPSEQEKTTMEAGAYSLNINTHLSAPLNPFLVEYNHWLSAALDKRMIMPNPCTTVHHHLYLESEVLGDVHSHRVVIPFSEIRWEGQGVAKVVTKDGKAYVDTNKSSGGGAEQQQTRAATAPTGNAQFKLTDVGGAVRRTALLTLVQEIQAQELMLREVNGKGQDEWHSWVDKMTTDLMEEGGTSWGECLETGVWWATKQMPKK